MTRQELRVFLAEWQCGCGSPDDATRLLYDVLRVIETRWRDSEALNLFNPKDRPSLNEIWKSESDALKALLPSDGVYYFVLYILSDWDLLEHGGSVGGSWLTEKGKALLAALEAEKGDGFSTLHQLACVHGYSVEHETCEACARPIRSKTP